MLTIYTDVKLLVPFGDLPAGIEGTIVQVYPKTAGYIVEFVNGAVESVPASIIEAINP